MSKASFSRKMLINYKPVVVCKCMDRILLKCMMCNSMNNELKFSCICLSFAGQQKRETFESMEI